MFFSKVKLKIKLLVFSLLLSCLYILGNHYVYDTSIPGFLVLSLEFISYSIIYFFFLYFLFVILNTRSMLGISFSFPEHFFTFSFIFLLILWIPHLTIKYPVGNCRDAYLQILSGLGERSITAKDPLVDTLILNLFVQFGILIGNINIGIFCFAVSETFLMALVFSYAVFTLKEINTPNFFTLIALIFFAASPFITGYVAESTKDVLFNTFFVLFFTVITRYLSFHESFWKSRRDVILLLISTFFVYTLRYNGPFLIVPLLFIISIKEIKAKNCAIRKTSILCFSILLPVFVSFLLNSLYNPESISAGESLSLPFQQTARFVKYHPTEITDEEWDILEKIFPYASKDLGYKYREDLSDPVKERYNKDATTEDLVHYFRVWFRHLKVSPSCYLSATLRQNIYLFYPGFNNYSYFIDCNADSPVWKMFSTPDWIKDQQKSYLDFLSSLHEFPLLSIFNNMAIYFIALVAIALFAGNTHDKLYFLLLLPLFITILMILFSPCIRGHVRYAFPVIWTAPIWIGVFSARHAK